VAVLVDILTDNRNRTASDVRSAFNKTGGSLAEPGSVSFLFTRRGQVVVPADGTTDDEVLAAGLDAGLEDVEADDEVITAWCDPSDAQGLREALEAAGLTVTASGSTMVPSSTVPVTDVADAKRILRLLDLLDDSDDVQEVYANFDMDDDVLQAASED
jgi:YebC/PmpR family DNA-binding regulatory protein